MFIFSSPEPLGSQGELIVYPSSRHPSVAVVNNFKHLLLLNRWADQSQVLWATSKKNEDFSIIKFFVNLKDDIHKHFI